LNLSEKDISLFDDYLNGELTGERLEEFNNRLKSDPDFKREFDLHKEDVQSMKAIGQRELKSTYATIHRSMTSAKKDPYKPGKNDGGSLFNNVFWVIFTTLAVATIVGKFIWPVIEGNEEQSSEIILDKELGCFDVELKGIGELPDNLKKALRSGNYIYRGKKVNEKRLDGPDAILVCFIEDSIYRNNYLWSDTLKIYHDKGEIDIRKLRAQHYLLSMGGKHYIIEKTTSLLDLVIFEISENY